MIMYVNRVEGVVWANLWVGTNSVVQEKACEGSVKVRLERSLLRAGER